MNSDPIQVLHVLGRLNRGGAELRTLELMKNMDRMRYKFHVCCLSGLPGELDGEVRSLGGEVHLLPLGISFPAKFRRLLRDGHFGAVHSHVHWPSGYIVRLAAQEEIPQRICHFASTWDGKREGLARRLRNRLLKEFVERYATDIVGVSEGALAANFGPGWPQDPRCRVIYRGIEVERFREAPDRAGMRAEFDLPPDAFVVLHVGRMDPPKNHERLVRIFERFLRLTPNAYLLLVGAVREPIASRVRQMADQAGVSDRIRYAGIRSDLPRLLKSSDLMIFPSLWEGLPGSVLEAVAAQLPVLATDLPGIREIAQYLPGLLTMSLDLSDDLWAEAALDLQSRTGICTPDILLGSPFSMERSVAASDELYCSGGLRQQATSTAVECRV